MGRPGLLEELQPLCEMHNVHKSDVCCWPVAVCRHDFRERSRLQDETAAYETNSDRPGGVQEAREKKSVGRALSPSSALRQHEGLDPAELRPQQLPFQELELDYALALPPGPAAHQRRESLFQSALPP